MNPQARKAAANPMTRQEAGSSAPKPQRDPSKENKQASLESHTGAERHDGIHKVLKVALIVAVALERRTRIVYAATEKGVDIRHA